MTDAKRRLWEQALVIRCQAGDERAFAELVAAYQDRLARYVAHLIGPGEVDDVLQQVWLDVYVRLHTLRHLRAFRAWLYRIARDKAYASCRQHRRRTAAYREQPLPHDAQEEPVFSQEQLARVRTCLQRLPIHHRDVLTLRFFEDMTYEDIATTMRCRVGTVRSRI